MEPEAQQVKDVGGLKPEDKQWLAGRGLWVAEGLVFRSGSPVPGADVGGDPLTPLPVCHSKSRPTSSLLLLPLPSPALVLSLSPLLPLVSEFGPSFLSRVQHHGRFRS